MRSGFFLLLFSLPWLIDGLRNVTVDDDDPGIRYEPLGAWHLSANSTLDFGYAHMLTEDPNATAVFNFTGVAIYFMSPLWPYAVTTTVALDDGFPIFIDLVDHSQPNNENGPETVQSHVVWSATGLNNTQHTLVISVPNGNRFAIVDGLVYTIEDTDPSSNSTSPPSSPSPSISGDPSTPGAPLATEESEPTDETGGSAKAPRGQVIGGIIAAVIVILAVIALGLYFFFFKRRTRQRSKAEHPPTPPRASFAISMVDKQEAGTRDRSPGSRTARLSGVSISSPRSLQWGMYEMKAEHPLRTNSATPPRH